MNVYHQSLELVERYAQCLLKDSKTKDDIDTVKQLGSYITYFSNEMEMIKQRENIFENYVNIIDSATEKPDCDSVIEQFHNEINEAKRQLNSIEKNEKYVNFMKMISEHDSGGNDTEIETISEIVNTIDPITKLPIVDPVKNKKCGHTYDKTSICKLIEQNPKTRCPIAGCVAADFVKKSDLVPDNALKRVLSNASSNPQKRFKPK